MTTLKQLTQNMQNKETVINEDFSAVSFIAVFAHNSFLTSGLDFGYYGGKFLDSSGNTQVIVDDIITLTDNADNYVEVDPITSTISANTTSFTAGSIQLYKVVTLTGAISTIEDFRVQQPAVPGASSGLQFYEDAQDYTGSGVLIFNHALNLTGPYHWSVVARCLTAEFGYVAGQEIIVHNQSFPYAHKFWADADNVYVLAQNFYLLDNVGSSQLLESGGGTWEVVAKVIY